MDGQNVLDAVPVVETDALPLPALPTTEAVTELIVESETESETETETETVTETNADAAFYTSDGSDEEVIISETLYDGTADNVELYIPPVTDGQEIHVTQIYPDNMSSYPGVPEDESETETETDVEAILAALESEHRETLERLDAIVAYTSQDAMRLKTVHENVLSLGLIGISGLGMVFAGVCVLVISRYLHP